MATAQELKILGSNPPEFRSILAPDALRFIADLESRFGDRRRELMLRRQGVQDQLDRGVLPDFLPETEEIRRGTWKIAPVPTDLIDRRVEITGPVDRKMVINALNSGAKVFMADFEDSHSPTWTGTIQGQINLFDAVRRNISLSVESKHYALNPKIATLMVRPRGWHLEEKHVRLEGRPISASLFDFGLFFFHNAQELIRRGSGPYFYLPKLESHLEARLWNDVFMAAQDLVGIKPGTIKATVLIETILAAFEMDEILYELRDHSAGLNCGRWDYIFSFIKKFRNRADFLLPDRQQVTMTCHFLKSYSELVIRTCHRRGAHAMGGMAAQIPIKNDPELSRVAMEKVRADKLREVKAGHDGTWVAHPALIPIALEVFDAHMKQPNQLSIDRSDVKVTAKDLLAIPPGTITSAGLKNNIAVGVQYLEAWLRGNGCVPLFNLMEDAATAEISRAQLWQWINNPNAKLEDGRKIDVALFRRFLSEETQNHSGGKFELAAQIFDSLTTDKHFCNFLTTACYDQILEKGSL